MNEQDHAPQVEDAEPMKYEEPPRLSQRDALGVVLALIALVVIGVAGYIWLTPGLEFSTVLARLQPHPQPVSLAAPAASHTLSHDAAAPGADASENQDCAYCGMPAEPSAARALAVFTTGTTELELHFDSLSCAYKYAQEHYGGAPPAHVQVLDYDTYNSTQPTMFAAETAWFLYGTQRLPGSMAPFIATFTTREDALAQQAQLGGELVQFTAVQERLQAIGAAVTVGR